MNSSDESKEKLLSPGRRHHLIKTTHPSPRSCNRDSCNERFRRVSTTLRQKCTEFIEF
jgi:uracil DNA glycosylase